mmetsp:Transcript_24266/g.54569  ORF Transcript_24266/g.54569 Transcript_24266/m.54569 type:complete len:206 (-) Transcript_24266:882-1499(-)
MQHQERDSQIHHGKCEGIIRVACLSLRGGQENSDGFLHRDVSNHLEVFLIVGPHLLDDHFGPLNRLARWRGAQGTDHREGEITRGLRSVINKDRGDSTNPANIVVEKVDGENDMQEEFIHFIFFIFRTDAKKPVESTLTSLIHIEKCSKHQAIRRAQAVLNVMRVAYSRKTFKIQIGFLVGKPVKFEIFTRLCGFVQKKRERQLA